MVPGDLRPRPNIEHGGFSSPILAFGLGLRILAIKEPRLWLDEIVSATLAVQRSLLIGTVAAESNRVYLVSSYGLEQIPADFHGFVEVDYREYKGLVVRVLEHRSESGEL